MKNLMTYIKARSRAAKSPKPNQRKTNLPESLIRRARMVLVRHRRNNSRAWEGTIRLIWVVIPQDRVNLPTRANRRGSWKLLKRRLLVEEGKTATKLKSHLPQREVPEEQGLLAHSKRLRRFGRLSRVYRPRLTRKVNRKSKRRSSSEWALQRAILIQTYKWIRIKILQVMPMTVNLRNKRKVPGSTGFPKWNSRNCKRWSMISEQTWGFSRLRSSTSNEV